MNNIVRDYLCNYGFYDKEEGLASDVYEKDCNKPGTKTFEYKGSDLMFCDEYYQIVTKNQQ